MVQYYKKIITRPDSLLRCECWYNGESKGLKKLTGGKLFFDPLFVYNKSHGFAIYYNVSDPVQDPNNLINYFTKKQTEYKAETIKFLDNCHKIVRLVNSKSDDLKKILALITTIYPMVDANLFLGSQGGNNADKKLSGMALQNRKSSEKVIYDAEKYLLDKIKITLSSKYKRFVDILLVREMFSGKLPTIDDLKMRRKGFVYYRGKLFQAPLSQVLLRYKINIIEEMPGGHQGFLKGHTANKGLVCGRARLVFNEKQAKELKAGEIMVAPMTNPNFLQAIKRSAGIITDEGGITCHAAIVARELNKPCVIGTKHATKLIKTGQIITLDADKGQVKLRDE